MIIDVSSATGTQKLWKQERIILFINASDAVLLYTDLKGSAAAPIATYTPQSGGDLYIDVTDYVRANPQVEDIYVVDVGNNITYHLVVEVVGLINPASVIVPLFPGVQSHDEFHVIPPRRMYKHIGSAHCQWEARLTDAYLADDPLGYAFTSGGTGVVNYITAPVLSIPFDAEDAYSISTQAGDTNGAFLPLQCGVNYAMVRWESFTGATRCHTMEAVKAKSDTKDAFSLLQIDNEYVDIKGREDGFTLRLSGLSAYDLWYYADMIHSSKVEVSLDGDTWDRVQVTKKSFTMPDGESSNGVLEIQVNWKRYDAVAM